jgi:hypothetical protein
MDEATSEIRQLARLIAAELAALRDGSIRLLTAAEIADRYGLTRAWVYRHARELGGQRMGTGPKAPIRFDPVEVRSCLDDLQAERTRPATSARRLASTGVDLLPISPRRARRRQRPIEPRRLSAR